MFGFVISDICPDKYQVCGFVISELLSLSCLQETSHACDEVHRPASPSHLTPHVKGALERISKHMIGWNLDVWQITFVKHLSSLLLLAELKVADCVHAPSHCRPTLKLLVDKSFGVYNAPGQ